LEAGDVSVEFLAVFECVVMTICVFPDEALIVELCESGGDGTVREVKVVFEPFGLELEFGVAVEKRDDI
jgi:hypothetical protein